MITSTKFPIGKFVKAERLQPKYFHFMLELLNDTEINRMEGKSFKEHNLLMQQEWFEYNKDKEGNDYWVFIDSEKLNPVGYFSYKVSSKYKNQGHIGIKLSSAFQGKGLGKDILKSCEFYYFHVQGVNKLVSHIVEYNFASQHLFLNSCHWKKVGIRKNAVIIDDKSYDQILIELNKNDFIKLEQDDFYNPLIC